jgi:serine carboxypeptidase-like clade 1
LDGYFYEQGPLHFVNNPDKAAPIQLELNPYRWNAIANMIFLEAPVGVGFSYSDTQFPLNDTQTSQDNYAFLLNFFAAYPEYSKNPFFVAGESYAGVYVPTLVDQIMMGNAGGQNAKINLEGFMVGNGCTGNNVGSCSPDGTEILFNFLYGHGLFTTDLFNKINKACKGNFRNPNAACSLLLDEMSAQVNAVNIYNIYYPCVNGGAARAKSLRAPSFLPNIPGPVECIDGIDASAYLNQASVRQAIHVVNTSVVPEWTICAGINYNSNIATLMPLYPKLIKQYRVLIFNGDVDACVPYNGNEAWTESLKIPVKEGWRAWMVDNQVAGYVTTYDVSTGFAFLTVKGAGHMVPEFMPPQAFAMFQRFLTNTPF